MFIKKTYFVVLWYCFIFLLIFILFYELIYLTNILMISLYFLILCPDCACYVMFKYVLSSHYICNLRVTVCVTVSCRHRRDRGVNSHNYWETGLSLPPRCGPTITTVYQAMVIFFQYFLWYFCLVFFIFSIFCDYFG